MLRKSLHTAPIFAVAAVVAAAVAIIPLFTVTAQAQQASCPPNRVCLYQDAGFGGARLVVPSEGYDNLTVLECGDCRNSSTNPAANGTWNDQMTSWFNNTNTRYCWYYGINQSDMLRIMNPGIAVNTVLSNENDQASSIAPC